MKPEHKELLRERARDALRNLYHNTTPNHARDLRGRTDEYYQSWFEGVAEFEMEYLNDGGAYGLNPRATIDHSANRKYKSDKAHARYVAHYLRRIDMERSDCGMLTGWRVMELAAANAIARRNRRTVNVPAAKGIAPGTPFRDVRNDALWECATEYGKIYQYGRGGRTVAPSDLMTQSYNESPREDYADEMNMPDLVRFIRIIESFNRYVESWNDGVAEMWKEHCDEDDAADKAFRNKARAAKAKETKERNYWAQRDTITKE